MSYQPISVNSKQACQFAYVNLQLIQNYFRIGEVTYLFTIQVDLQFIKKPGCFHSSWDWEILDTVQPYQPHFKAIVIFLILSQFYWKYYTLQVAAWRMINRALDRNVQERFVREPEENYSKLNKKGINKFITICQIVWSP